MSASRSRRGARVTVQLAAADRDRLRELAAARGQTISALLRSLALAALTDDGQAPDEPVPETPEAMREQVLVSAFKAARDGDVQAMRMVLLELRQPGANAKPPADADGDDEEQGAQVTAIDALRRRAAGG